MLPIRLSRPYGMSVQRWASEDGCATGVATQVLPGPIRARRRTRTGGQKRYGSNPAWLRLALTIVRSPRKREHDMRGREPERGQDTERVCCEHGQYDQDG